MHQIESQSLVCGAKIDKPFIYKHYFPFPFEKYVVFSPQCKNPSKDYVLWQDVINILLPALNKENIKIIQIGETTPIVYNAVINMCGKVSLNQIAYLIENSLLFFGVDGFECHIASVENKPLVSISSSTYSNNTGPYFGDKEKQFVFESYLKTKNKKPSFNPQENPKSINLINPEEIAEAVISKLGLDFKIPFKTVYTGSKYGSYSIQESIPDFKGVVFNPENPVEIRADLGYNEEDFATQLSQYKKCIVLMDKPINLSIIKKYRQNIIASVFKVTDAQNLKFVEELRKCGPKLTLVTSLSKEEVNKLKINYYQIGNINKLDTATPEKIEELRKDVSNLYYRSAKITASKGKYYYSFAAARRDIPMQNQFEYQKVIDCPQFYENLEFFTVVKLNS